MIDALGYFDKTWLAQQTTERLRYEARCEHVRNWRDLPRHSLTLILGQTRVIGKTVTNMGCESY